MGSGRGRGRTCCGRDHGHGHGHGLAVGAGGRYQSAAEVAFHLRSTAVAADWMMLMTEQSVPATYEQQCINGRCVAVDPVVSLTALLERVPLQR